ncbi:MAG: DUF5012 domain-containing protein [Candidatus Azobacteroides sp.]|nr:DUF5012 domain-containing protein [Candidatus Azobacteroides sp.]
MKVLYKYCLIVASVFLLFSCEKETEGISRITYYCELDLKGDPTEFISLGSTYNEAGWVASENGENVTDKVTVNGTVNANTAGIYRLVYSVYNSDGFAKTAVRQVIVYDTTPSVIESGFYEVSPSSNRTSFGSGPGTSGSSEFKSGTTIIIYQISAGKFYISDFIGGYYDVGRGYGSTYAMTGLFQLNSDNTIELIDSRIAGWGDGLDAVVDGVYDPTTKTLTYTAQYAESYDFNIIATKIN